MASLAFLLLALIVPAASAGSLDTTNPVSFFTNLAGRLLKMELNLDLHRLQIHPTNQYTPAVHRLLQVTANLYDAVNPTNDAFGPLPTVFRPRFKTEGDTVFIESYEEVVSFDPAELSPPPLDLNFSNAVTFVKSNSLIFGVPFVLGARKRLPNFNEFTSESVVQITRKLELRKSGPGSGAMINQTNQMFIIGISNGFGAEFWNSYASNYTRPVEVAAFNWCLIELTNDYGFVHRTNLTAAGQIFIPSGTNDSWPGWNPSRSADGSLLVPLRSNHIVIPYSVYSQVSHTFMGFTDTFETTPTTPVRLPLPRWGLTITNRVVAFIRDSATGRLLDYVQLDRMVGHRAVTEEMAQSPTALDFAGLWATNFNGSGYLSGGPGVRNQIMISAGEDTQAGQGDGWQNYGIQQPSGATKYQAIAKFRAFFTPNNQATFTDPKSGILYSGSNSSLQAVAPFSPTWKQSVSMVLQANDPLVHYTAGDMEYLELSGVPTHWNPPSTNWTTLVNLGRVSERYRPWGGNPFSTGGSSSIGTDPNAYNHTLKDPLVRSAGDWDFPEGEPPSLALLRRVHRGTPWQTVYLKSAVVSNAFAWRSWTGNRNPSDAERTVPTRDWKIAALIVSLNNTNDPRSLLSINEHDTNAWLATLDGIVALTNSTTDIMLDDIAPQFDPLTLASNSSQASFLVEQIRAARSARPNQRFEGLDELLAVAELTTSSPFLNLGVTDESGRHVQLERGLSDEAYERIPVQLLSRLRPDSLGAIVRTAEDWRIQFTGFDGFRYAVEESTNLLDWQAISTNEPADGFFEITLPGGAENRFYRSALLP